MDLAPTIGRVLFAWIFVLALVRLSGRRTIKQADTARFVVAIVLGDLVDDLFWAEVQVSQFAVAAGMLVLMHTLVSLDAFTRGSRIRARRRLAGRV